MKFAYFYKKATQNSMSDMILPPELTEAVKKNELIVFVGAGLSYNLLNIKNEPIQGWENLVRQILNHLKGKGFDVNHLLPLIGKYEPIKILDLIESDKSLPKGVIVEFMKNFFDLHETANDYSLHRSIFELSRKIITTNYDTSFERAISELRKNTAYKGKNYELTKHKDVDAPLLFKLHGCYENAGTMVLFPSGYKDLYNNSDKDAEHSLLVLRNIIVNKSILFIGAGMGDFQINNIFSEIKKLQGDYNQKHFIVTRNSLDSQLGFLTPICIKGFDEIKSIIDNLNQVKKELTNQKTPEQLILEVQLQEMQEKLKEAQEKLEKYEKGEVKDKNEPSREKQLLTREAIKYFIKGVTFHLDKEFEKAIENYQLTTELKPDNSNAYNNWGTALSDLAELNNDEGLYSASFEKYQKATELKPDDSSAYYNWGNALYNLAKLSSDEGLYRASFEKYQKATELKPDDSSAYYNWGNALSDLAKLTKNHSIFELSLEKLQKNVELGGKSYNLSCLYALKKDIHYALYYLDNSLKNKENTIDFIKDDEDWKDYLTDPDFLNLLEKYSH